MNLFQKLFCEKIIAINKKREKSIVINCESKSNNEYIITLIDSKNNIIEEKINKNNLKYKFFEKTNNYCYKKYKPISIENIITEMDSADAGFGSFTTDHGATPTDSYAPGDNRRPTIIGKTQRRNFPTDSITKTKSKKKRKKKNAKRKK